MDPIQTETPAAEASVTETPAAVVQDASDPVDARSPTPNTSRETSRAELESKVAESLKTFREIDDPAPVSEEPVVESKDDTNTEGESSEIAESDEDGKEVSTDATEPQPEAKKPSGPTLPDAYRRSLKAYDWTDEEIDKSFKANPLEFTVTAQRLHANRNRETSQWAEAGRAARANQPQSESQPKANPFIDAKTGQIKPLDVAAMSERYGNPELVAEIVAPVNEMLSQINAVLPDLMTGISTVRKSREEQLTRQVDEFFVGKDLQPFAEAYGKDTASLTEPQIEARNKVLEMADALVAGAGQQGRKLSVKDAMMMAHDHVSSGLKVQTIRKELKSSVTKRNAGLTTRPSPGGKTAKTGPATSRADMEARTKARMAAVFKGD